MLRSHGVYFNKELKTLIYQNLKEVGLKTSLNKITFSHFNCFHKKSLSVVSVVYFEYMWE